MKLIVNDRSGGTYKNEGELFSEPIRDDTVRLMGEMIALQALRNVLSFDYAVVEKLYNGLIKDLHHMNEPGYIISEGYDFVQIAVCFLLSFKGRYVSDICGNDRKGKAITIKCACFREVDSHLTKYRRRLAKARAIDFSYNRSVPADCFVKKSTDYSKADAMMDAMHLTEAERETLNCYMNGMKQSEAALYLGLSIFGVKYRKQRIRQKYHTYIGQY